MKCDHGRFSLRDDSSRAQKPSKRVATTFWLASMAMAPRKMAICVNGTPTHMRSGHVDMLMTFERNHPNLWRETRETSLSSFLSSTGAMKREQMLSAILEADKDPSKLLELVKKHVSRRQIILKSGLLNADHIFQNRTPKATRLT